MSRSRRAQSDVPRRTSARWGLLLAPSILAFLLVIPCISFRYLADDFAFLQRGASFHAGQLLPDPRSIFFRPISRELYFGLLNWLSPTDPLLGHLMNSLLLVTSVLLLTTFGWRLGGLRLGVLSGSFLACLGAVPILVGWVSGAQDLFAMLFIGIALHMEWSGRRLWAVLAMAGALLSKETAAFFLPALASLRFIETGNRRDLVGAAARYAGLVAVWILVHPRLRDLLAHGFATGEGGYVGVDNPSMLSNAAKTFGTFLNIPPTLGNTPWPSWTVMPLMGALIVIATLAWLGAKCPRDTAPSVSQKGVLWVGLLLGVFPALLTVITTKYWFPYYASMPAIGISILAAFFARRLRWKAAMAALATFACLGVWYRGTDAGNKALPAEANVRAASQCLARIEKSLRELHPSLPDSSRIYLALESPKELGLRFHLVDGQGLRVWYDNMTLVTRPVEYQDKAGWAPFLFWVTPSCEVFEITLPELEIRRVKGEPSYASYQRAIRGYAFGAWSAGDTDRGVSALLGMREADRVSWDFDRRLAAAFLFASDREQEGGRIYSQLPKLGRDPAVGGAAAALTTYVMRSGLDEAVFRVFGLSYDDPEVFRDLMFYFSDKVLLDKAQRMAERLLELHPGDEDATAMIAAIRKVPKWEEVLVGPDRWGPPGPVY